MAERGGHVVLLTGEAPYLGGPSTWRPLCQAAPEYDYLELDLLGIDAQGDIRSAARAAVQDALFGARAIVAHGTSAAIAIEAVAAIDPAIPVLLISPRIVTKLTPAIRLLRSLTRGTGARMLTRFAKTKHARLLAHRSYVRKQLQLLVRDDCISEDLLREAQARIADPRMNGIVDRTADALHAVLTPIDTGANQAVRHRAVLLGNGLFDRKARALGHGTIVHGATSAAMIEAAHVVAQHLRALVGEERDAAVSM